MISLKQAEKKAFKTSYDDGLWDIFLGCFFLMFAVAPILSTSLGDFWSSVVFLPFWGLVYLAILQLRKHVVAPRLGTAQFGKARKARLAKFSRLMLLINLIALGLGLFVLLNPVRFTGWMPAITFGLIFLIGLSLAAYWLDFRRLYFYGLLAGLAPLVGEWLFRQQIASHHGFPLTFSLVAGTMILTGVLLFIRLLRTPVPELGARQVENS